MTELASELTMISSFVLFQFVLAGEAETVPAPRIRTLVLPFLRMLRCNMPLKVGLSLKGPLMLTACRNAIQGRDVDVVNMRLKPLACFEENLAVASWPGT
jgi:hypothetical protein